MIENEDNNPEAELTHRRRGGAFDTIARVLRNVGELVFRSGIIMRNRAGVRSPQEISNPTEFVQSESVFEAYHKKAPEAGQYNLMFIGVDGKGFNPNTNYIELSANAKSADGGQIGNGQVRLGLKIDGVDSGSYIGLVNNQIAGLPGGVRVNLVAVGSGNGVQLSYFNDAGTLVYAVAVDEDGIQLFGVPSSPGVAGALYKSTVDGNANVLRIST